MKTEVRAFVEVAAFFAVCLIMVFVDRDEITKDTHQLELAGLGVAMGLGVAGAVAAIRGRDRIAAALSALIICLFLNCLTCNYPTDPDRFGYGFPWKWCYDPGWRSADGREPPQHARAVTPFGGWSYDIRAAALDAGLALAVIGAWLLVNELLQRSRGNRPDKRP
jgi:hypothetical protein